MHPYPHTYRVTATGSANGPVPVAAAGLAAIPTAPPPEFDGPGGSWSPEMLLVAAVADCFVLSFRAVGRAARFDWQSLECRVEGVLDRVDGVAQFSHFRTSATLTIPPGAEVARARQLLEKAEHVCLIANSLKGARQLECTVDIGPSSA
jgi:organic hydroperoxide reductase OsmC/OhrA